MKIRNTILTVICAFGLMACSNSSPFQRQVEYGFALDWNQLSFKSDKAKKDTLKDEQFKLNLKRVTDLRSPEERMAIDEDYIIHDYRPNNLLNGLETYVDSSVNKYMNYSDEADVQLGLEIDIKRFKTTIEHAWFQRYGKYNVDIELDFTVRDKDSRVLMRETLVLDESKWRKPSKGQLPSVKRDRKEIKRLVKSIMSELTLDMGWMVHTAFNQQRKYYHPMKEGTTWTVTD